MSKLKRATLIHNPIAAVYLVWLRLGGKPEGSQACKTLSEALQAITNYIEGEA